MELLPFYDESFVDNFSRFENSKSSRRVFRSSRRGSPEAPARTELRAWGGGRMALLYRATRLRDRADTHVFVFVVTRSATRDPDRDVTSKDFCCAHQRWAVAFSRHDDALGESETRGNRFPMSPAITIAVRAGVYLVWRGGGEGVRVYADFAFTLLSRDHFSANEGFSGEQVRFSAGRLAQGRGRCVPLRELSTRFADSRGEFQLELAMSRVRTLYSCELRAPRLESAPVAFAGYDWAVALSANGEALRLVRLSGGSARCRARYALAAAAGDRRAHSGPLEHVCDAEDSAPAWTVGRWLASAAAARGSGLRLTLELVWARALAEVRVPLAGSAAACYDRDRQAWALRCDTHSDSVRLHMLYRDVHHVPRNHLRYVSWSAWLVSDTGNTDSTEDAVPLPGAPFSHYYAQENADEGLMMETPLSMREASAPGCRFVHTGATGGSGELLVRLEWSECYLLFQATYHIYDDLCRRHGHQMR
ncbi:hypothetical protein EVAR_22367_1 [Eumeta japonica]|uniref:MATH domain-containing protein n=1 Tax=Eumeta variegata TaxID=151549 RepID=A0A4C1VI02_EUMVA|nr:hypothetical protein EVAR_22367_1 [Eumeta japonica]